MLSHDSTNGGESSCAETNSTASPSFTQCKQNLPFPFLSQRYHLQFQAEFQRRAGGRLRCPSSPWGGPSGFCTRRGGGGELDQGLELWWTPSFRLLFHVFLSPWLLHHLDMRFLTSESLSHTEGVNLKAALISQPDSPIRNKPFTDNRQATPWLAVSCFRRHTRKRLQLTTSVTFYLFPVVSRPNVNSVCCR